MWVGIIDQNHNLKCCLLPFGGAFRGTDTKLSASSIGKHVHGKVNHDYTVGFTAVHAGMSFPMENTTLNASPVRKQVLEKAVVL